MSLEEPEMETFVWQAVYQDKTVNQYNPDGSQNSYNTLNRDGLKTFNLITREGKTLASVPLAKDAKLFYRMRVAFQRKSGTQERIYILGWQSSTDRHIWIVYANGTVETYRNFVEDSRWLYAPIFREYEKVRTVKPQQI